MGSLLTNEGLTLTTITLKIKWTYYNSWLYSNPSIMQSSNPLKLPLIYNTPVTCLTWPDIWDKHIMLFFVNVCHNNILSAPSMSIAPVFWRKLGHKSRRVPSACIGIGHCTAFPLILLSSSKYRRIYHYDYEDLLSEGKRYSHWYLHFLLWFKTLNLKG